MFYIFNFYNNILIYNLCIVDVDVKLGAILSCENAIIL